MCRGDFREAHAISDRVLARRDPGGRDDPRSPYHLRWVWDGQSVADRHVLVRCYHGLGDTLQFARYLAPLRRRAASVTVEAQPELVSLLATLPGPDRLVAFRPSAPSPALECDVEIMELAHALRLGPMGETVPYFATSAPSPVALSALRVGLCARAGAWDQARSVPPTLLRQACAAPGVSLVDLTHPQAADGDARSLPSLIPDGADGLTTARALAGLDLVVTVDTMVAHLAGALGRPTWVLLRRNCDWRWMEDRTDSPWYPTMRLYRQDREGDWSGPLARVQTDLRIMAAAAGCS